MYDGSGYSSEHSKRILHSICVDYFTIVLRRPCPYVYGPVIVDAFIQHIGARIEF